MGILFDGSSDPRNSRWILLVGAFVLLALIANSVHEPWADEAQAWLIARDASLHNLLFQLPHAEMNPSLWHLILRLPSRYLDYGVLPFIALFFSTLGVAILARYSPFPTLVKVLIPFSYFVFFQYTVVARSYCLFALALFAIATLFRDRYRRPLAYCLFVATLVYTHSYGALAGAGLVIHYVLGLVTRKDTLNKSEVVSCLSAALMPVAAGCFLLFQVFPTRQRTLTNLWYFDTDHTIGVLRFALNESLAGVTALSLLVLVVSLWWFWQRRVLFLFIVMVTPVLFVFSIKFFNDWHIGLLFLVWITVLWVSLDPDVKSRMEGIARYSRYLMFACLYGVLGLHVYWSVSAVRADWKETYSCGPQVAGLLQFNQIQEGRVFAKHFWTIAALPYFDGKLFYNINPGKNFGYWTFFEPDPVDDMNAVVATRPDAMVIARQYKKIDYPGYKRHDYSGKVFWKDRVKENNRCTVYIREDLYRGEPEGG